MDCSADSDVIAIAISAVESSTAVGLCGEDSFQRRDLSDLHFDQFAATTNHNCEFFDFIDSRAWCYL